jgi:hypothetical protein
MSQFHPTRRFAAMILNGPYRQDSGHHAALDRAAQLDPYEPFVGRVSG